MATSVEEWLAEGNEITRELDDDETIHEVEFDGTEFRFQRTSVPGQYRCLDTGAFGHVGSRYHRLSEPKPYRCHKSCGAFGTVHAHGWYWCPDHAPEGWR